MRIRRIVVLAAALTIAATGLVACTGGGGPVSQNLPIRAAFYYPTFPEWWNQQGFNPFTNYTPTRGYYDTNNVVAAHVQDMLYAGQTAGIASWWGQGTKSDGRMPNLLAATAGTKFQWTPYYEPEGIGDPTPAVIKSDLDYLASKYANDPGFLHVNGKPVIFAFAQGSDGCAMADRWHNADPGHAWYVDLKVFPGYKACANQPDSWHQYGPSSPTDAQAGYSYSISPGFWKKGEAAPRLARDPARFTQNVQSMAASGAPWQLTTTFDEWGEGTAIESATQWASASGRGQYLDILHSILGGSGGPTTTTGGTSSTSTSSPASTTTTSPSTSTTASVSTSTTVTSSTSSSSSTTTTAPTTSSPCGNAGTPNRRQKVVVFAFENRTWSSVGGTQFGSVPYFHGLATTGKCPTFANYTEPDTSQNSATQYVGQWAGSTANTVRNDCQPSASCQSTQDNIGRQVRAAGLTVRSYVEGATSACSASGNAAKHIPALYFRAAVDASHCATEVRPISDFNPNGTLADFSFITPTLCNDGHDCSNATVSSWASHNVASVLNSAAYKAGNVTVFIWYDEDHPVPNMQIGLHAIPGVKSTPIDYGSTLRAWESLLGLPFIAHAATATDLRPLAGI